MNTRAKKTLERVLSKAGAGSRTDARQWICAGRVKVNAHVVRDPDHWVDMKRDRVRLDGKPLRAQERVYLLLYKPTGYLTTYRDPGGRPTVYDLIADVGTFVSPVGRLDLDTSGLLLMTNDNQLAERVTNPESHVPKTYLVKASTRLTDEQLSAAPRRRRAVRRADTVRARAAGARLREVHPPRDHIDRRAQSPGSPHDRGARREGAQTRAREDRSNLHWHAADW